MTTANHISVTSAWMHGQLFVNGGAPELTQYDLPGDLPLPLPHAIRRAFV